ncbi:MAG: hypothetical protein V4692_08055 [Bdellovibrionota bacterium]
MRNSKSNQAYLKGFLVLALAANASWNSDLSTLISTDMASNGEMAASGAAAPAAPPVTLTVKIPDTAVAPSATGPKPDSAITVKAVPRISTEYNKFCGRSYRYEFHQLPGETTSKIIAYHLNPEIAQIEVTVDTTTDSLFADPAKKLATLMTVNGKIKEKLGKDCVETEIVASAEPVKTTDSKDPKKTELAASADPVKKAKACSKVKSEDRFNCSIDRLAELREDLKSKDARERRRASSAITTVLGELKSSVKTDMTTDIKVCDTVEALSGRRQERAEERCEAAKEKRITAETRIETIVEALDDLQGDEDIELEESTEVALDGFKKTIESYEMLDEATDTSDAVKAAEQKLAAAIKNGNPMARSAAEMELRNALTSLGEQELRLHNLKKNEWESHNSLSMALLNKQVSKTDFDKYYVDVFNKLTFKPMNLQEVAIQAWSNTMAEQNTMALRNSAAQTWGTSAMNTTPPQFSWLNGTNSSLPNMQIGNQSGQGRQVNVNFQQGPGQQFQNNGNFQQGPGQQFQGNPQLNPSQMRI